jgi:hypothetical protein
MVNFAISGEAGQNYYYYGQMANVATGAGPTNGNMAIWTPNFTDIAVSGDLPGSYPINGPGTASADIYNWVAADAPQLLKTICGNADFNNADLADWGVKLQEGYTPENLAQTWIIENPDSLTWGTPAP